MFNWVPSTRLILLVAIYNATFYEQWQLKNIFKKMWQIRNANCESSPKGVRLQVMCLILYDLLLAVDIVGSISTGASL